MSEFGQTNREWLQHEQQLDQTERHHIQQISNAAVEKLTYFIIGTEVVICGYILLNLKDLHRIPLLWFIFLLSGSSVLSGLLWRFLHNLYLDGVATQYSPRLLWFKIGLPILSKWWVIAHNVFLILSVILLVTSLAIGTNFICVFKV